MTTIQVSSSLNLGTATLGFALPVRTNLQALVIPSLNYKSGTSMANLAYAGAPALTVAGSPSFDAYGMFPNAFGDGLQSTVFDSTGDLTLFALVQNLDTLVGGGNTPEFVTTYNADTGGLPTGAKGAFLGMATGSGNVGTISSISRTSNVVTVTLSAAASPAYVAGQLITVSGVTADTTMNTGTVPTPILSVSGLTFTYASTGANGSSSPSAATCWNGSGKPSANDTIGQLSGTAVAISAISRTGSTCVATVASLPTGVSGSTAPVIISGVTGDTSYNGVWTPTATTSTSITFTCAGVAGSGVVTSATAGLAVYDKVATNLGNQTFYNTPRFLAFTLSQALGGVRTLYDLSAGGATTTQTVVGNRIAPASPAAFFFGSGLTASYFGKHKMFAAGVHVGTALTAAQLQQNYAVLAAKTGFG